MLTDKSLEDAGYKRYKGDGVVTTGDYFYQKAIWDEDGNRLYFIIVEHHRTGWEMQVQYNGHSDIMPVFNVVAFGDKLKSVQDVEAFFEMVYVGMRCEPYERKGE